MILGESKVSAVFLFHHGIRHNFLHLWWSLMIVWSCLIIVDLLINHPGLNKVMSYISKFPSQLRMVPKVHMPSIPLEWLDFDVISIWDSEVMTSSGRIATPSQCLVAKQQSCVSDTLRTRRYKKCIGMFVGMHSRCVLYICTYEFGGSIGQCSFSTNQCQ